MEEPETKNSTLFKRGNKKHRRRKSENQPPKISAPVEPANFDSDFGQFNRHTKGFGLKILKKFGFKGRLGKNETGRVNPIIPERPKKKSSRAGLNYVNTEKEHKKSKRRHKKRVKSDDEVEFEQSKDNLFSNKGPKNFKIKTAEEVLRNKKKKLQNNYFDYTKDKSGKITNFDQNFNSLENNKKTPFKMFCSQLNHSLDQIESEILLQDEKHEEIRRQRKEANQNLTRLLHEKSLADSQMDRLEKFSSLLNSAKQKTDLMGRMLFELDSPLEFAEKSIKEKLLNSFGDILQQFELIRTEFEREFLANNLSSIIAKSIFCHLFALLEGWSPLMPDQKTLNLLKRLRGLLSTNALSGIDHFNRVPEEVIVPKLRNFVINEWSPLVQNADLINLLEIYRPVVSEPFITQFFNFYISDQLSKFVLNWNFDRTDIYLANFISPWQEFDKNADFSLIFDSIKSKISLKLANINLIPQKHLIATIENLKSIIPPEITLTINDRLEPAVSRSLVSLQVNPQTVNFAEASLIFRWGSHLNTDRFSFLLHQNFFEKFISTFHIWVSSAQNGDETTLFSDLKLWYDSWRSLFPLDLFADRIFIQNMFIVLDLLYSRLTGVEIPPLEDILAERKLIENKGEIQDLNFAEKETKTSKKSSIYDYLKIN